MAGVHFYGRRKDNQAPSLGGRLGLSLFFFFFFAIGSLFEVLIIREFGRAIGQQSWKKVPCTVVSSAVQERNDSEQPYAFAVRYQYEYRGQAHTGTAYKRSYSGSDKYSAAQQLVQKYPAGQNSFCYVNPANAGQVVLKRDNLLIGLVLLFPLIFVAIGAGGIYFFWKKQPPEAARPIAATALREARAKGKGRYVPAALFAFFALAGGGLLYPLGIRPIGRTLDARSWVATPCRVLRAEVRSHDSDDGTTYSVYILYEYEFGGQTYKSDRYEFIGGSSSGYQGKARVVAQYQATPPPPCYVNPNDPSEAVLRRGFHAKLLLALLPLTFLLIGVGGLVGSLRGKAVPAGGTTQPALGRRPAWVSAGRAGRQATADGRAILTPKASARAKFIGVTVLALFWNGILSIFIGNSGSFSLLLLLPFMAVGVGLIAGAVYQFLAMFSPRPLLELSAGTVPLGGAAELSWRFAGQTGRIDELTVTLRGVEEARYRRGTNTCTDRDTFYEMELYRTADPKEIAAGQVGFVLPTDTMHSFEAENNKILWNLDVHGSIRKWPDVKESFPIAVTPAG